MKVWLDSFSFYYSRDGYMNDAEHSDECMPGGDCGGDCENSHFITRHYNSAQAHFLDQECASLLAAHHFQLANTLYIQPCDASHWLICNPIDVGKVAVIDKKALALLGHFRVPTTLQEITSMKNTPIAHLTHIMFIFIDLGFLYNLDREPVVCNEKSGVLTLTAWLHITNACNLRCHYCYISKSPDHMEREVSRRAVNAVIRSAVHHGYGRVQLKYAGGEAALQMPQMIAIHDHAQQQTQEHHLQLSASLLTNGTIMTPRMIELLKERRIHVMISLDGIGAVHDQQRTFINRSKGSFTMVDRTISRLLANDLRPSINVTISQRNIADLPTLLSYILERDLHFTLSYYRENDCSASITDLQFSEVQMIDGMRAAFVYIEQHLPKRRIVDSLIDKGSMHAPHHYTCGIGRNYLVINERGEVAKCQADITRIVTTIQADDPLHEIRSERTGMQAIDVDHKEGCRTCTWRYWCGGGCPQVTYRITGRNDIRSPNCAIYKALYPEAVRLEALRLLKYETPIIFENPFPKEV